MNLVLEDKIVVQFLVQLQEMMLAIILPKISSMLISRKSLHSKLIYFKFEIFCFMLCFYSLQPNKRRLGRYLSSISNQMTDVNHFNEVFWFVSMFE